MPAAAIPAVPVPRRLSPSALSMFESCPKAFEYRYVLKEEGRDRPSPVLVVGNAVHGALERFYGLPAEDRIEENLHLALRSVWKANQRPGAFIDVAEEAQAGRDALAMLTRYASFQDLHAVPVAREEWVSVRIPGGRQLFGKADRIDRAPDGGLAVIDYKTGRHAPAEEELPGLAAAQVYALAAAETFGMPVSEFRLVFLALGRELSWHPDASQLDAARESVIARADEIAAAHAFPARPGDACRWCDYAHACPYKNTVALEDLQASATGAPF